MIIALEKHDGSLYLFDSVSEAEAEFEGIDIKNGEYEFCDEAGQRFIGEIVSPDRLFRAGSYRLRADGAARRAVVASLLSRARSLERSCAGIKSLEDLRKQVA